MNSQTSSVVLTPAIGGSNFGFQPTDPLRESLFALLEYAGACENATPMATTEGPLAGLIGASRRVCALLEQANGEQRSSISGVFEAHHEMLGRQLERFSSDLRTARRDRNSARSALASARLEALHRLIAAAELKDNDTGVHIIRMGHFSAMIARGTGQTESYCEMLLHASRMHDVGKIGIPDAILKKQGKLTDEEWVVMRTHPQIGAALLSDTEDPLYNMAEEIALSHHEKFDGSGYPNRLCGEKIPLSARIVALADFFDAVTMDRCYRPAMPDEQALELIRAAKGSHFDPLIVESFFRMLPAIIEVRARVNRGEAK